MDEVCRALNVSVRQVARAIENSDIIQVCNKGCHTTFQVEGAVGGLAVFMCSMYRRKHHFGDVGEFILPSL